MLLVELSVPAGYISDREQPRIDIDEHLALRPWRESDAEMVKAAFDAPDIQRWHVRRMADLDEARAWIATWPNRWHDEEAASWAIIDAAGDQPIGQVGLRGISLFDGSAHLSYWVVPSARGRGAAVQAANALTCWSFAELGLHRMSLEHSMANEASCRVATKLGFAVEGIQRGAARHTDGWHDMHVHGRLRAD
jgi:RimJ/RimL family protein N-acetyltransferase